MRSPRVPKKHHHYSKGQRISCQSEEEVSLIRKSFLGVTGLKLQRGEGWWYGSSLPKNYLGVLKLIF